MKKTILLLLLSLGTAFAEDLSKCNIDVQGDPDNKPECYKQFPTKLTAGMKLRGWPTNTILRKSPDDSAAKIAALGPSGHWTDEEIELTGKLEGEWAEVILRKFEKKMESCDDSQKEKWNKRGWIRSIDRTGKPIIWLWLYTGLC